MKKIRILIYVIIAIGGAFYVVSMVMAAIIGGVFTDHKCYDYCGTTLIMNGVYLEKYRTYGGGVCGGDVVTSYLTDSVSYRVEVGKEFDHDSFDVYEENGKLWAVQCEYKDRNIDTLKCKLLHIDKLTRSRKNTLQ